MAAGLGPLIAADSASRLFGCGLAQSDWVIEAEADKRCIAGDDAGLCANAVCWYFRTQGTVSSAAGPPRAWLPFRAAVANGEAGPGG